MAAIVEETPDQREKRREKEREERCKKLPDECKELKDKAKWVTDPQPLEPITTVESLAAHLYLAAQVELSTIPLYLYAAWSIKTKGYSQWSPGVGAFRTILGVAIEEMLHLSLVRNLIVAIGYGDKDIKFSDNKPGTKIKFYDKDFVPTYPGYMLHHQPLLCLGLKPLSTNLIECAFMPLEKPKPKPAEPVFYGGIESETYETLGQFYDAIKDGFEHLDKLNKEGELEKPLWGESCPERQYYRGFWNQFGGGTTVPVVDLETALTALRIIVEQGEGAEKPTVPLNPADPRAGLEEWSHYEKFKRVAEGIEGIGIGDGAPKNDISIDHPLATWPVISNPKTENYDGCHVQSLMTLFNAAYCYVLSMLDEIYHTPAVYEVSPSFQASDGTDRRYGLERSFVAAMQGLLYPIADLLVRTPTGRKEDKVKYKYKDAKGEVVEKEFKGHAGPPFEFYEFGKKGTDYEKKSKKEELVDLCEVAMKHFPMLGGDDGVQRQISLLMNVEGA
jgi:hypothetical protein